MKSFPELCRDVFLLAGTADLPRGRSRGQAWERVVSDYLASRMVATECAPGGLTLMGHTSLSGLGHQIDSVFASDDAIVIAEWKAHQGAVPKNELLRFKAASDDYLTALGGSMPRRPVIRMFGGPGFACERLRRYAALHGIVVIDARRWPAPVLASTAFEWPAPGRCPSDAERRILNWGSRPWQAVMRPVRGGAFFVEGTGPAVRVDRFLRMESYWSDRLWKSAAHHPAWLERTIGHLRGSLAA